MKRCACRPSCLTWLRASDDVVQTPAGPVLADHVAVQPYPGALGSNNADQIIEVAR